MANRSFTHTHEVNARATVDGADWACSAAVRLSPFKGGTPIVTDLFGFERYDSEGALNERRDELDPLGEVDVIEALELAAVRAYLDQTTGDHLDEAMAELHYDMQPEAWN